MKVQKTYSLRTLVIMGLLIIASSVVQAGENDTAEAVMGAARQGSIESADTFIVVNEANSFLNRLSSDKAFAAKLLSAIQKNDRGAVTSAVKETAPRSQVSVDQLKADFLLVVGFRNKTRNATVCLSSENGCSGHAATVVVK